MRRAGAKAGPRILLSGSDSSEQRREAVLVTWMCALVFLLGCLCRKQNSNMFRTGFCALPSGSCMPAIFGSYRHIVGRCGARARMPESCVLGGVGANGQWASGYDIWTHALTCQVAPPEHDEAQLRSGDPISVHAMELHWGDPSALPWEA